MTGDTAGALGVNGSSVKRARLDDNDNTSQPRALVCNICHTTNLETGELRGTAGSGVLITRQEDNSDGMATEKRPLILAGNKVDDPQTTGGSMYSFMVDYDYGNETTQGINPGYAYATDYYGRMRIGSIRAMRYVQTTELLANSKSNAGIWLKREDGKDALAGKSASKPILLGGTKDSEGRYAFQISRYVSSSDYADYLYGASSPADGSGGKFYGRLWAGSVAVRSVVADTSWNYLEGVASDERLKKDIVPFMGALGLVNSIRCVEFRWDCEARAAHGIVDCPIDDCDTRIHPGFIAQQMQEVYPNVVHENDGGYLGVEYRALVPVVAAAIKDLHQRRVRTGSAALQGGTATVDIAAAYGTEFAQLVMALLDASASNPHLAPVVMTQNCSGWDAVRGYVAVELRGEHNERHAVVRIECASSTSTDRVTYTLTVDDAAVNRETQAATQFGPSPSPL